MDEQDRKELTGCSLGCIGTIIALIVVVDLLVLVLGVKSAIWLWNF